MDISHKWQFLALLQIHVSTFSPYSYSLLNMDLLENRIIYNIIQFVFLLQPALTHCYFNVLSKVGSISPYYISNFAFIWISKGDREKIFHKTVMKFERQNIIFNKVLSRMSPFRDIDLGEMGPDFQSTVYSFSCLYGFCSIKVRRYILRRYILIILYIILLSIKILT